MTTRERLAAAFADLGAAGYTVRERFWCCQSCAGYALADAGITDRYVYYHVQDAEAWDGDELRHPLYLAWAGDGTAIAAALIAHGLAIAWDGRACTRIAVLGIAADA